MNRSVVELGFGEYGIVLSNPLQAQRLNFDANGRPFIDFDSPPAFAGLSTLNQTSLIHAATFYDKLVWPVVANPFFSTGAIDKLEAGLIDGGMLHIQSMTYTGFSSNVGSIGNRISISSDVGSTLVAHMGSTINALNSANRGKWTLSAESDDVVRAIEDDAAAGLACELINAVPIVSEINDVEDFQRWKEQRKAEIRRLHMSVRAIVSKIEANAQNAAEAEAVVRGLAAEVSNASSDLLRVTTEMAGAFKVLNLRFQFNSKDAINRSLEWAGHGSTYSSFAGQSPIGATIGAIAGLVSEIQISRCPGSILLGAPTFPYALIPKLQYPSS